jgi:hypothetical protein
MDQTQIVSGDLNYCKASEKDTCDSIKGKAFIQIIDKTHQVGPVVE